MSNYPDLQLLYPFHSSQLCKRNLIVSHALFLRLRIGIHAGAALFLHFRIGIHAGAALVIRDRAPGSVLIDVSVVDLYQCITGLNNGL